MSAADELPQGSDPSPNSVVTSTINYLGDGGTLGALLQGAVFGTFLSVFTGGVNLIQSIVGFVTAPVDAAGEATGQLFTALITSPLSLISETATTSAQAIGEQFGPFAFIFGVAVLLGGMYLITQYLEQSETSNFSIVPGFPDLPFVGVTEENEDEN